MEVLGTSALPSVLPVVHSTLTSPVNTPRKVPTPLPLLSGRSQSPAVSGEDDTSNSTIRASKERFYASASATASGNGGGGTNDTALTFHRVTPDLALVALLPSPLWESRRALVEYNVVFFREGVQAVWEAEWKARQRAPASGSRAWAAGLYMYVMKLAQLYVRPIPDASSLFLPYFLIWKSVSYIPRVLAYAFSCQVLYGFGAQESQMITAGDIPEAATPLSPRRPPLGMVTLGLYAWLLMYWYLNTAFASESNFGLVGTLRHPQSLQIAVGFHNRPSAREKTNLGPQWMGWATRVRMAPRNEIHFWSLWFARRTALFYVLLNHLGTRVMMPSKYESSPEVTSVCPWTPIPPSSEWTRNTTTPQAVYLMLVSDGDDQTKLVQIIADLQIVNYFTRMHLTKSTIVKSNLLSTDSCRVGYCDDGYNSDELASGALALYRLFLFTHMDQQEDIHEQVSTGVVGINGFKTANLTLNMTDLVLIYTISCSSCCDTSHLSLLREPTYNITYVSSHLTTCCARFSFISESAR
jgi:hypothetical protein